jgi:hypothetical protein
MNRLPSKVQPMPLPCPPTRAAFTRIAVAIAVAIVCVPAVAADEGPADAIALDAVTVTAQRRIQDIQEVPLAVSALDDRLLRDVGASARDVLAIGNRAPSLQAESSFGRTFPRFYIRGLGNSDFDLNASQPVSLVVDGIVMENPALKGFPIFDLERAEVLRGPQGTLFGRNTPVAWCSSFRHDRTASARPRCGSATAATTRSMPKRCSEARPETRPRGASRHCTSHADRSRRTPCSGTTAAKGSPTGRCVPNGWADWASRPTRCCSSVTAILRAGRPCIGPTYSSLERTKPSPGSTASRFHRTLVPHST